MTNKTNRVCALILSGMGWMSFSVFAAVETVTYGDFEVSFYGNGDTFSSKYDGEIGSSQDWSQEMKDCVGRALNYWSDVVVSETANKVKIAFAWENLGAGVLGGASPLHYLNRETGIFVSASQYELQEWTAPLTNYALGETTQLVRLSANADFYFGEATAGISWTQYDLQSVLVHEIGHLMGFNSFCNADGWTYKMADGNVGITTWDSMLVAENEEGELVSVFEPEEVSGGSVSTAYNQVVEFSAGKEFFLKIGETEDGELELSTLKVYNPGLYSGGSSMSHVVASEGGEEPEMSYAVSNATVRRELTAEELTLLRAMGWTIAIPEPSAFGLLVGLVALAVSRRRRRGR